MHNSISEIPEGLLVNHLLGIPSLHDFFLGLQDIPNDAVALERVPLDPLGAWGDIDILLCAPDQPNLAVAVEVKRVKVRGSTINNLKALQKGVLQTNRLAALGFSQVYFFVLVVADTREQNRGQVEHNGPSSLTRSVILQAIRCSVHKLFPTAGAVQYDFVQPTDDPPFTMGSSGIHLLRSAQKTEQPSRLTRWVASLFENGAGHVGSDETLFPS